jgi:pimeloyl-ACP methyl ester carboxylesterase
MKKMILLIPGNPSVPGIYEPFLKQFVTDLGVPDAIYKVLPHLGQCNTKAVKRKRINVFDVIQDHKKNILNLIEEHGPKEVILIGHSLGSAVSIALHDELHHLVNNFIVLCPFAGPSRNNVKYLKMFKNPVSQLGMKAISYSILLNKKYSQRFFRRWLGENPFNELIPQEIKKPYYIKNFFSLVSTYIPDFEELKVKEKLAKMNPDQSFFLFAAQDYWVPGETVDSLPKGAKYKVSDEISHDFCLKSKDCKIVSSAIVDHLKEKVTLAN